MRAMILAAGLGTRLRPLTEKTPKALLIVDGRPLIVYSLLLLKKHGVRDVLINLHYLGELIEFGPTKTMFTTPSNKQTEDYITGRFG